MIFQNASTGHLAFKPTAEDNSNLFRNSDGTWSRVYRNGIIVYFDSFGRQLSTVDRVGRTKEMTYDSLGRLSQIKNPVGQIISYSYSGDKLSSITDPAQRVTEFKYNFEGFLTKVIYPDGTSTSYEYSYDGLLIAETNQRNAKTQYQYNVHNRLEKVIKPDTSNIKISDSGSQTAAEGEMKNISNVDNVVTDSNGNNTTVEKDFMGYVHSITDAEGKITKIKRDLKGRTIEIQRPDGNILQNVYDQITGDLLSSIDTSTGQSESNNYDQYGNLVKRVDSKGNIYLNEYSPSTGLLVKTTAPGNRIVEYQYNNLGLVTSKLVRSDSQTSLVSTYQYDSRGLVTKKIAPDGKYVSFSYDQSGNMTESISQKENGTFAAIKYFHNSANQLIKVITPNGEITEYSYLATGELSQIKDPKEKISSFEYDLMGRLIKKSNPLNQSYFMTYDGNGNLIQEIDPNGNTKALSYTQGNKLKQVLLPDNLITYEYNLNGEVLSAQNKHSKVSFTRDVKDRISTAQVTGLNEMSNYPENGFSYSYDGNDNLIGLGSVYGSQILSYDELNRLTQIQTSTGSQFQFNYDDINRLTKITRPGSLTDFSYNSGGMISDIIHSSNGVTKSFTQYNYDLRNFPVQKRNISGISEYSYDLAGQVTNVTNPEQALSELFNYDSIGNRLTDKNGSYIYDQTAQLIKEDYKYFYAHDNNGNLVSKTAKDQLNDSFSYTYSSTNQLTSIRVYQDLSSPIKKQINYFYDAYGRRIQKEVIDNVDVSKSHVRKFVYNGDNIFVEFNGNNQVIAKYTHSPLNPDDILESEITDDGVQSGLAGSSGKFQYLKDVLGTVTDILDSNGNVVQRYDYSTYGRIRSIKNNAGVDISDAPLVNTSFTFTGREYDSEVGLYYYRARYYDANSGRFLQRDPDAGKLQNPITFVNKYTYVGNNPVMYSDPSGKVSWFVAMFVGAMVGGAIGIIDWAINGGDLMEKFTRGAITGALYGLAFALNPVSAAISLGTHIAEAGSQGGNFFENFNSRNDPIKHAMGAVASAWASNELAQIGNLAKFHPEGQAFATLVYGVASVVSIGLIINTADNFLEIACDDGRGSWSRGDICKALK